MKTKGLKLFSSLSSIVAAVATILGITSVVFASGGAMFNPGSLSIKSGAPLSGVTSHSEIQDCGACHASPWTTETMSDRCIKCHADITAQLNDPTSLHSIIKTNQPDLNCRTCHTEHHGPNGNLTRIPPGWNPHDQLGFSLKAHRLRMDGTLFECKDCHAKGYTAPFDQTVCAECHLQVNQTFAQKHILTFGTNCQACHDGLDSHGSNFDHSQVPFKLVGIHTLTECAKCHANARNIRDLQSAPQDCFACHQKDDAHAGQFGTKCGMCHTAEGWKKSAQFDHNLASFKLVGKHTSAKCDACHVNNIYKGTPSDCFACHAKDDKHAGKFGTDCGACHTPEGWNRAVDHSKFVFHLDGKHANVACEACHVNGVFSSTPTDCVACHAKDDSHAGQLGTNCGTCHTPDSWSNATFDHNTVAFSLKAHVTKSDGSAFACRDCHVKGYASPFDQTACAVCHLQVNQGFTADHILTFGTNCMACHDGLDSHGSKFNHNLVAFPLIGKHGSAACSNCHVNDHNLADLRATSQDCFTCHQKDDAHAGQLGTTCEACHTPAAWKPANVDHSKFAFHLDGKHSTVACTKCHVNNVFKGTPKDCASCHQKDDAHSGKLGTDCASCHTPNGWTPSTFDHSKASFALTGKHVSVVCAQCHADKTFAGAPTDCVSCHQKDDKHNGQFGTNCATCHTPDGWALAKVDHSKFAFHLDGQHATVACEKCHVGGVFKGTPQDCASCHLKDDAHAGQLGTLCGGCHTPAAWKPAIIDHSQFAFHLDGKHSTVACTSCHINGVFKDTPTDCGSCHTKDDAHAGQLGTQCGTCHTPVGWKPATVDHSKFAFHLDGKHSTVTCTSCHVNGVFKGTPTDCASCHQKDDAHAGQLGTQCGTCHTPNGWRPATFDHNTVAFSLKAHTAKSDGTLFACQDCHTKGYVAPFDQTVCADCHLKVNQAFATQHILTFWTNCMACHDGLDSHGSNFDHSKVPFNLAGKHVSLDCSKCHDGARSIADLKSAPQDCYTCHQKDDHHNGQFGTNCATCHTPDGWALAKVDHTKFAFHLDGKHATVACELCHVNGVFKGTPKDCASCHLKNDPHGGKLGTDCASCHTPAGWTPSTFDHNRAAFHLDGKHASATCSQCHTDKFFVGTPKDCASCHQKDDAHSGKLGTDCASCHTPNGWVPSTFDHSKAAFALTGKHVSVVCTQCHADKTFVGAPTDCFACHQKDDKHNGQFGTNCATCHTPDGWALAQVDHSKFAFQLIGKHATVACTSCHVNGVFKGTPTDCTSCHLKDDAHAGKLGTQCGTCHTPTDWKNATFDHNTVGFSLKTHTVKSDGTPFACTDCHVSGYGTFDQNSCAACHLKGNQTFTTNHILTFGTICLNCHDGLDSHGHNWDHNRVAFGLNGKHILLDCSKCHNGARTIADLKATPQDCFSCHQKDDAHGGQLGTQCGTCHTPNGWKPATIDHSQFAFHLDGKHAAVACAGCHVNGIFKGTPKDCASCHQKSDPHGGLLGTDCASCHTPAGWKPATFDHTRSIFQLTGAHVSVACNLCHTDLKFKGTPTNCYACHASNDHHAGAFGTDCALCHSTAAWNPPTFDHSKSAFPLTGFHTTVLCAACHINGVFKGTPTDCYSCHKQTDPHGGNLGTNCSMCHNTTAWKPSTFNHNISVFKLTGAHTTILCTACHVNGVFKGTPQDCYSCHKQTDPHGGNLGTNCSICHTTSAWKPSTFDHNKSVFKLTGAHTTVACTSCHKNGVFKGTPQDCYSCHASNDHHGGKFGTNCAICHSTTAWKPATFDHSKSAFPLTGAHVNVDCTKCHVNGVFKGTPTNCSSCHADPAFHAGAFGSNCSSCHNTTAWKPAKFGLAHPNVGAGSDAGSGINHGGASCRTCHPATVHVATCLSCHDSNNPGGN